MDNNIYSSLSFLFSQFFMLLKDSASVSIKTPASPVNIPMKPHKITTSKLFGIIELIKLILS